MNAYRTVTPTLSDHLFADVAAADAVVFASPSAVYGHLSQLGEQGVCGKAVCIGRTTAAACADADLPVAAVAANPTDDGLVDAVIAAVHGWPEAARNWRHDSHARNPHDPAKLRARLAVGPADWSGFAQSRK